MLLIAGLIVLAIVSTAIIWVGSDLLERASDNLAAYYGLPAVIQGAVLVGVGSSMPELLTAILAPLIHGDFELGISAIIGSAIFNILVIPALATLVTGGGLSASREIVYKEAQFYLIAVAVFLLMLSMAVIYFPLEAGGLEGELTPLIALVPLALYLLYAFIQYQDLVDFQGRRDVAGVQPLRAWGRFLGGFVLILIGVEGLLRVAIGFGTVFDTPSFIWGLTIVAIATSIPDTFVSIRAAQREREITGIANVFGSNVFDLLVAAPAGVLVVGSVIIDFSRLAPLVGVLIIATIILFTTLRTGFTLSRREAWLLLVCYLGFAIGIFADTLFGLGWVA